MEKINHPEHYKGNKYEAIDIIDDYQLGVNHGTDIRNCTCCMWEAKK